MHYATQKAVPARKPRPRKAPWNANIAKALKESKQTLYEWITAGRPGKNHILSKQRTSAKKLLRQAQRQQAAKLRRNNIRTIMAAKEEDSSLFHSLIRRQRESKSTTTNQLIIVDAVYTGNLAPAWTLHFIELAKPSSDPCFTNQRQDQARKNVKLINNITKNNSFPIPITKQEVAESDK